MLKLEAVILERGPKFLAGPLSLELHQPGITLLCGRAGSGKSTLLSVLKALMPLRCGRRELMGLHEEQIGLLLPDPQNQLLSDTVLGEISLPLRYQRLPRPEILERCHRLSEQMGILELLDRSPRQLSGGQQQLVCLAAILIQRPRILLLDEAFRFLDQEHLKTLIQVLQAHAEGNTVLMVSHRRVAHDLADRVLKLQSGGIVELKAAQICHQASSLFLEDAVQEYVSDYSPQAGKLVLDIDGLCFGWSSDAPLFSNWSARLDLGAGLHLKGPQGSGKSTLLLILSGLLRARQGRLVYNNGGEGMTPKVLPLFQFAERQFSRSTLGEEIRELNLDLSRLDAVDLPSKELLDIPLKQLGNAERRLAALQFLLLMEPDILLLDEPFAGLDPAGCLQMLQQLGRFQRRGGGLLIATHDQSLATKICSTELSLPS